jgi:hypothetical protein
VSFTNYNVLNTQTHLPFYLSLFLEEEDFILSQGQLQKLSFQVLELI